MKAITTTLYVCSSLMVAATILGAVDYSSASRKGILDKLYKEEKSLPVIPDKDISIEDYSRGEIKRQEETPVIESAKKEALKKKQIRLLKLFQKRGRGLITNNFQGQQ